MIKGKPPRLDQIYVEQPLYFVTICTLHRRPLLTNPSVHQAFDAYCRRGSNCNVAVGRYVIMPDHLHLFVRGGFDFDLGLWVRGLKRATARAPRFWQPGFFDRILRSDESYAAKWNYVLQNPVRAGLVRDADEWRFHGEIVLIDRA